MHPNVHSSTSYNNQDVEATQMPIKRRTDKEDVVYIYIQYIKKNEILPFVATWMDLENIMLSEIPDGKRKILYDITYMRNLKNELIYRTDLQT